MFDAPARTYLLMVAPHTGPLPSAAPAPREARGRNSLARYSLSALPGISGTNLTSASSFVS